MFLGERGLLYRLGLACRDPGGEASVAAALLSRDAMRGDGNGDYTWSVRRLLFAIDDGESVHMVPAERRGRSAHPPPFCREGVDPARRGIPGFG